MRGRFHTALAASLLGVAAVALTGCFFTIQSDLDGLKDETWVDISELPEEAGSSTYPVGVAAAGPSTLIAAGSLPNALVQVSYDNSGGRTLAAVDLTGFSGLREPAVIVGDPGSGRVVLGVRVIADSMGQIVIVTPGDPPTISESVSLFEGDVVGIAFGATDGGNASRRDVAVVGGGNVAVVQDIAGSPTVVGPCPAGADTANGVAVADVDGTAGDEVLVGTDAAISVFAAGGLADCGTLAAQATIPAPDGATGFGRQIVTGDFDGDDKLDLAIASLGAVHVYRAVVDGSPTPLEVAAPAGATNAFGSTIVAADFDGDGSDELIVSDSDVDVGDVVGAGQLLLYQLSGDSFGQGTAVHDFEPAQDQHFGQSLAVTEFESNAVLAASGKTELFAYFRLPFEGDVDPRER